MWPGMTRCLAGGASNGKDFLGRRESSVTCCGRSAVSEADAHCTWRVDARHRTPDTGLQTLDREHLREEQCAPPPNLRWRQGRLATAPSYVSVALMSEKAKVKHGLPSTMAGQARYSNPCIGEGTSRTNPMSLERGIVLYNAVTDATGARPLAHAGQLPSFPSEVPRPFTDDP